MSSAQVILGAAASGEDIASEIAEVASAVHLSAASWQVCSALLRAMRRNCCTGFPAKNVQATLQLAELVLLLESVEPGMGAHVGPGRAKAEPLAAFMAQSAGGADS